MGHGRVEGFYECLLLRHTVLVRIHHNACDFVMEAVVGLSV
jgi:hypothetical protein